MQPNRPQKPKIDISQYFNDIGVLNKDSKPQPGPSVPNTIGAARKASLAKDVDPTVLKVKKRSEFKYNYSQSNRFVNGLKVKREIFEHYYVHYQI